MRHMLNMRRAHTPHDILPSCAVKLLLPVAKAIIKSSVVPSGAPQLDRRRITRAMAAGFAKTESRDFQSDGDVFACVRARAREPQQARVAVAVLVGGGGCVLWVTRRGQVSCVFVGAWGLAQRDAGDVSRLMCDVSRLTCGV